MKVSGHSGSAAFRFSRPARCGFDYEQINSLDQCWLTTRVLLRGSWRLDRKEASVPCYQVCWDGRAKTYRIRKLGVATETPTGFSQPGRPVALWPSKRNTFKRLVEVQAYLVSKRKDGAQTVSI